MSSEPVKRMQCLEIWGGNQRVDSGVTMAGLNAWVYSQPYGDSDRGGDVYYVSSCATGRITRLLVADVSGHGEAVAKLATDLRSLMRRFVNYLDQRLFVRELNARFTESAQLGSFATAVATTFLGPTNDLAICNAGHPPPLWYKAATKEWSFLESNRGGVREPANFPLGVMDLASYEQFGVRLSVGDFVICYTDSLIESRRPTGELLLKEGLLEIVRAIDVSDPSEFIPRLLSAIRATAPGNLTEDDVTALLFSPTGTSRVRIWDGVLGAWRTMVDAVKSIGRRPIAWPDMTVPNIGGAFSRTLNKYWRPDRSSAGPR